MTEGAMKQAPKPAKKKESILDMVVKPIAKADRKFDNWRDEQEAKRKDAKLQKDADYEFTAAEWGTLDRVRHAANRRPDFRGKKMLGVHEVVESIQTIETQREEVGWEARSSGPRFRNIQIVEEELAKVRGSEALKAKIMAGYRKKEHL